MRVGIMKRTMLFAVIVVSLMATGCATTQDLEQLERRVNKTNTELDAIKQSQEEIGAMVREDAGVNRQTLAKAGQLSADVDLLKQDVDVVKRNQASLGSAMSSFTGGELKTYSGQMDELRHEVEATKLKLDAFKAALLQKLAEVEDAITKLAAAQAAATVEQPAALEGKSVPAGDSGAGSGGVPPVADPAELYQSAYLDYTKGNYELAMSGFKDYLTSFPDGEFAGNAQYWIGESLYSLGHYKEAIIEFEKVLNDYPDSTKAPGAMLKKGVCYDALKNPEAAKAVYIKLIDKYPSSDAAKLAADRMNPKKRGQVQGR